jgi:hypothetical protein
MIIDNQHWTSRKSICSMPFKKLLPLSRRALFIVSWSAVITVPGQAAHPAVMLTQLA